MQIPGEPGPLFQHREFPAALVEAGVRQGYRGVRGEQADHLLVPLSKSTRVNLAGRENEAQDRLALPDRHAEHVSELGMRGWPSPEPRIRADVGQPERLALAHHDAEQAML